MVIIVDCTVCFCCYHQRLLRSYVSTMNCVTTFLFVSSLVASNYTRSSVSVLILAPIDSHCIGKESVWRPSSGIPTEKESSPRTPNLGTRNLWIPKVAAVRKSHPQTFTFREKIESAKRLFRSLWTMTGPFIVTGRIVLLLSVAMTFIRRRTV